MSNRLPIDPLYRVKAQHLTRKERKRIGRYTLNGFNRATYYPVDKFMIERHQRRELLILDMACAVMFVIIALCLIYAVVR